MNKVQKPSNSASFSNGSVGGVEPIMLYMFLIEDIKPLTSFLVCAFSLWGVTGHDEPWRLFYNFLIV
jgi:hypothetical protein